MENTAVIIGNSDGIGLALTREMLKQGWNIVGISRSESSINDPAYEHIITDVQSHEYQSNLKSITESNDPIDLCVFCAGIGEKLDIMNMENEVKTFEVNLMSMVKTATCLIPVMVNRGKGHFIGISSLADELISPDAPSYFASKAGFSNYLEGLALALKPKGVYISNVRFGFVNTKMAKGEKKPFMMSVEKSVQHLLFCIEKKPIRYTAPRIIIPLIKLRKWMLRLKI